MTTTVSFNIERKREWEQAATSEPFSKKLEVTTGVETRILLGVYTVRALPNPTPSNHSAWGNLGAQQSLFASCFFASGAGKQALSIPLCVGLS